MILLTIHSANGITRRCDARCYNGDSTETCLCLCGGANHSVGKQQAIQNTQKHWQEWIASFAQKHGDCTAIPASIVCYIQNTFITNEERNDGGTLYVPNHLDKWLETHSKSEAKDLHPQESHYIQERLWT